MHLEAILYGLSILAHVSACIPTMGLLVLFFMNILKQANTFFSSSTQTQKHSARIVLI